MQDNYTVYCETLENYDKWKKVMIAIKIDYGFVVQRTLKAAVSVCIEVKFGTERFFQ